MTITDSTVINVLNCSDNYVSIATHLKPEGYLFEPSGDPSYYAIPLSFVEIKSVNTQSNVFREGILKFEPDVEKEVYEKLGIYNWEEIISDSQIREIILHPTKDGLEKLIKITSPSEFERVRGMLIQLENSGLYDISQRVRNVVTERYRELYHNKRSSDIVIVQSADETQSTGQTVDEETIAKLKEELEAKIRAEFEEKLKNEQKSTGRGSTKQKANEGESESK